MPILTSDFYPSLPFRNGHFNTIYRPLFAKEKSNYTRKRITTWDHDFIDLDFSIIGSNTIVLLVHGLEGSSESKYMISTSRMLNQSGLDTVCMNLRGCSGEDNLLLKTYHSGKTDDIAFIVNHILATSSYEQLILVGFSLGGNLTLKYLGEYAHKLPSKVKGAITVSVPIDLTASQAEMNKLKNKVYMRDFLRTMKIKLLKKAEKHPEFKLDKDLLHKATKFRHIEKQFTVPVFGFESSEDYWGKASSKPYIPKIQVPTLLINAKDDSFLSEACFPYEYATGSEIFHLLTTTYGGHVGFMSSFTASENTWLEHKIDNFIKAQILKDL